MHNIDSFINIFSAFYPKEKNQFFTFVDVYNKYDCYSFFQKIENKYAYHFIAEMYNNSLAYRNRDRYSNHVIRHRRRRRGIFYDNATLSKFETLYDTILENKFIDPVKRDEIIYNFSCAQRVYRLFCRAARLFKIRKAKPTPCLVDMCLTPFDQLSPSILINVYDDSAHTMYTFRISDLINIINISLIHSPDFFANPQYIKNPYTNIPFTKAQLYHIYFRIRQSSLLMPLLFHHFFLTKFNLDQFLIKNEAFIREEAIKQFVKNMNPDSKVHYIKQMLFYHQYDMQIRITIDPTFAKEKLIESFSSYLLDYLIALYSLQPENKIEAYTRTQDKLHSFSVHNPLYGRIIKNRHSFNPSAPIFYNFSNQRNGDEVFIFRGRQPQPPQPPQRRSVLLRLSRPIVIEPEQAAQAAAGAAVLLRLSRPILIEEEEEEAHYNSDSTIEIEEVD